MAYLYCAIKTFKIEFFFNKLIDFFVQLIETIHRKVGPGCFFFTILLPLVLCLMSPIILVCVDNFTQNIRIKVWIIFFMILSAFKFMGNFFSNRLWKRPNLFTLYSRKLLELNQINYFKDTPFNWCKKTSKKRLIPGLLFTVPFPATAAKRINHKIK